MHTPLLVLSLSTGQGRPLKQAHVTNEDCLLSTFVEQMCAKSTYASMLALMVSLGSSGSGQIRVLYFA